MSWKDYLEESTKVVFVIGPTATGKSSWALQQAQKYNGSIVNIDSVQFYQGLEVGSAAPTIEDKSKVPHYFYSTILAPSEMTAGEYIRQFYELLKTKIKTPIFVVGGTGFYIQALEKGMYDIEPVPAELRNQIEIELLSEGAEKLYSELKLKDPKTQIHLNDHYRLVRALEIIRFTGKTPSELKENSQSNKNKLPYPYLKIGFDNDKNILEEKVHIRTKQMINNGIINETQYFLQNKMENWVPLSSVGFKETVQFLKESKSEAWLHESIVKGTMALIKKQKTWFKRDSSILWSNHSVPSLSQLDLNLEQFLNTDIINK